MGGGQRPRKAGGGVKPTGGRLGRIPAAGRWPRGSECERQKPPRRCPRTCSRAAPRRDCPAGPHPQGQTPAAAERAGRRLGPTGLPLPLQWEIKCGTAEAPRAWCVFWVCTSGVALGTGGDGRAGGSKKPCLSPGQSWDVQALLAPGHPP